MLGLIGRKVGMTSWFTEDGLNYACTVIEVEPNVVTQIRTEEIDGYKAVQVASGTKKGKNLSNAVKGHLAKAKAEDKKVITEFRNYSGEVKLGDELNLEAFEAGEFVDVVGNSKGKGFQGVVKRHGFAGVGGQTHGQHNRNRAPGSIGAASYPSKVFKGMRMAGQMGDKRVKKLNLEILNVSTEDNMIIVKGSVPGHKGSYVIIEK